MLCEIQYMNENVTKHCRCDAFKIPEFITLNIIVPKAETTTCNTECVTHRFAWFSSFSSFYYIFLSKFELWQHKLHTLDKKLQFIIQRKHLGGFLLLKNAISGESWCWRFHLRHAIHNFNCNSIVGTMRRVFNCVISQTTFFCKKIYIYSATARVHYL